MYSDYKERMLSSKLVSVLGHCPTKNAFVVLRKSIADFAVMYLSICHVEASMAPEPQIRILFCP